MQGYGWSQADFSNLQQQAQQLQAQQAGQHQQRLSEQEVNEMMRDMNDFVTVVKRTSLSVASDIAYSSAWAVPPAVPVNSSTLAGIAGESQQEDAPSEQAAKIRDRDVANGDIKKACKRVPLYINIMAWGESGMGKTTFIMNFLNNWELAHVGSAFSTESTKTSLEEFKMHPENMRITTKPKPVSASQEEVLSIQDLPGWGDDINLVNSLRTVVEFVLKQREKDLPTAGATEEEPQPGPRMKHAITACLYFLPPHRAKEMDWYMMEGISSLVAVIPVIAKADTHTEKELEAYRAQTIEDIVQKESSHAAHAASAVTADSPAGANTTSGNKPSSLVEPFKVYRFGHDDLQKLNVDPASYPPFAIMGSLVKLAEADLGLHLPSEAGAKVGDPCRKYMWGTALPDYRGHSNLIILKQLLMGHDNWALDNLLDDSWRRAHAFYKRYEQLKASCGSTWSSLLEKDANVRLAPLVNEVCAGFGPRSGEQQSLQDKLRCEEQHRLEHRLAQAQQLAKHRLWLVFVAAVPAFVWFGLFGMTVPLIVSFAFVVAAAVHAVRGPL